MSTIVMLPKDAAHRDLSTEAELGSPAISRLRRALEAGQATIAQGWRAADIKRARPIVQAAVAMLERQLGMRAPPRVGEPNLDFRHAIGMLQEVVPLVLTGDIDRARHRAEDYAAEVDQIWNRPISA